MKQVCTNSFLQLYLLILLNSSVVWAQNHTIKGTVLLADGTPGALATIQAIGTPKGTTTDEKGHFILSELAPGNYHLQISMIGYATLQQAVTIREKQLVQLTVKLQPATSQLNEVIVTGQYEPQSLKKSVYNVRVIDSERIRLRAAVNVMGVLNNELGFRFSNDLTLGTTDVQLMGMSGRNVKILLDGLPMVDRGDTRESLNQIDINSIERIEIVEGPMSVSYGSDALAGVVNIITKKPGRDSR